MITTNEQLISNKSYVNLDFPNIYPELLDLCQKLTERWVPESSNESDPGIVLLKLLAFVADKLNYNIDKNVLECFMLSATQEESMRNLCETNGYSMKYYRSATTPVSFMYTGDLASSFTLPRFSTVVSSEDDSISYTLIENCTISQKNITYKANAIEGTVNDLYVGDSVSIQLANLDELNRIYIPSLTIAENGIFVLQGNTEWTKVDNLYIQEFGSKVFKFGFDSIKELPYVEFPEDISSLIGSGLNIKYVVTSAAEGNISANTLTVLSSPTSIADNDTIDLANNLTVNNLEAASNGAEKESIEDAYNNYKKIVGTFNTLVTTRDYANFLYNLSVDNKPAVSNVHVSDRRDDFNYSNNIVTYEPDKGIYTKTNYGANGKDITAFDLCIYPFATMPSTINESSYNTSFTPSTIQLLDTNLADSKCIAHDIKELDSDTDIFAFKNYYKLNVGITTYSPVDSYQADDIIANIKTAIYKKFNAREVDFGEAIPFNTLQKVIQEADQRIEIASISQTLSTKILLTNGIELDISDDAAKNAVTDLVAKNILNGAIALFDFNKDIRLGYDQKEANFTPQSNEYSSSAITEVVGASSEVLISDTLLSDGYTLRNNEVIQFIAPNLVTSKEYGIYVNYRLELAEGTYIPKDTIYKLKEGDKLYIVYTDNDTSIEHKILYTHNHISDNAGISVDKEAVIIQPTFNLYAFDESSAYSKTIKKIVFEGSGEPTLGFWSLEATESICQKDYVTTTLNNAYLPCYWIMNNTSNTLFDSANIVPDEIDESGFITKGHITVLLDNGEYFMYSNKELTELIILGSGTRLTINNINGNFSSWQIPEEYLIKIEDINDKGLAAFSGVNWQNKQLAATPIFVEEMNIKSFVAGDTVTITSRANESFNLDNNFRDFSNYDISAVLADGTSVILDDLKTGTAGWQGRSRLDLNAGVDNAQQLLANQMITLYDKSYTGTGTTGAYTIQGAADPVYINFNYNVQYAGQGKPIAIAVRVINGVTVAIKEGLVATVYKLFKADGATTTGPVYPVAGKDIKFAGMPITYNSENMLPIRLEGFGKSVAPDGEEVSDAYAIKLSVLPNKKSSLIMMYYSATTSANVFITTNNDADAAARFYPSGIEVSHEHPLNIGMNIIEIPADSNIKELLINHIDTVSNDRLYVGKLHMVNDFNKAIYDVPVTITEVLEQIERLATVTDEEGNQKNLFYYLNEPAGNKLISINNDSNILSPAVFWDKNNIANKFTIGEIDVVNSTFVVEGTI